MTVTNPTIVQRWIVLLGLRAGRQIWLAYDNEGRIGNADYDQAHRYETRREAVNALGKVRKTGQAWPNAEIFGTCVRTSLPYEAECGQGYREDRY